jgi:hypothetical protein
VLTVALSSTAFCFALGCNDPYSQKRIAARMDHLSQLDRDIQASETRRKERLEQAGKTAAKWWRSDCERFNRRAPTIGDYVW